MIDNLWCFRIQFFFFFGMTEVVETNTESEQKEEIPTETKEEEPGNEKEEKDSDEIDPIIVPEEDEAMKKRLERFGPIEGTISNAKTTKPTDSTEEIDLDALIKNITAQHDDFAYSEFHYAAGIAVRRIKYWDSGLEASIQVNLVSADAESAHAHKAGSVRQHFARNVRLAADAKYRHLLNLLAQFVFA